jgi:hypothetical protein
MPRTLVTRCLEAGGRGSSSRFRSRWSCHCGAALRDVLRCANKKQGGSRRQTLMNASAAKAGVRSFGGTSTGIAGSRLSPRKRAGGGFIQRGSATPAGPQLAMTAGMAVQPDRDLRQPVSLERVRGIEPPSEAWEAPALPLSYTRLAADDRLSAASCKRFGDAIRRSPALPAGPPQRCPCPRAPRLRGSRDRPRCGSPGEAYRRG